MKALMPQFVLESRARLSNAMNVGPALAVLLLLGAFPALAVTRSVTNTDDSGPGSLRDTMAIAQDGDIINFAVPLAATIRVTTPLTFSSSVNISGPGKALLLISGEDTAGPVFIINGGSFIGITGVKILRGDGVLGGGIFNAGNLTLSSAEVTSNRGQLGGGIFNAGSLTLLNSAVTGNVVLRDHAGDDLDHENRARGGGIYNFGGSGPASVSLINSSVTDNFGGKPFGLGSLEPDGDGSGIYNDQGTVSLIDSTVALNGTSVNGPNTGWGGGIFNDGALVLNRSTVSNNLASQGSGIYNNNGSLLATNSTIADNRAESFGGGIMGGFQQGTASGTGTSTLVNSTLANNLAVLDGGGIFANSTVASVTVKNSIVAENTAFNGNGHNCVSGASAASLGHNLSDDSTCAAFLAGNGDLNNVPAGLDAFLSNNGGPTQTYALTEQSPAVEGVPLADCTDLDGHPLQIDQRSVPRPQQSLCDIGAYEFVCPNFVFQCVGTLEVASDVETLRVRKGTKRSLVAKLEAAVASLHVDDTTLAIDQLNAFINHTDALVRGNVLTAEEGSSLTTPTEEIIQSLSGG